MTWRAWLVVCLAVGGVLIGVRLIAFAEDDKPEKPAAQKDDAGKSDQPEEASKEEPKPDNERQPAKPRNALGNLIDKLFPPAWTLRRCCRATR